jgi:hypothetical protein
VPAAETSAQIHGLPRGDTAAVTVDDCPSDAAYSQAGLDAIAAELNGRPRTTLQSMAPSEKFAEAVATTR